MVALWPQPSLFLLSASPFPSVQVTLCTRWSLGSFLSGVVDDPQQNSAEIRTPGRPMSSYLRAPVGACFSLPPVWRGGDRAGSTVGQPRDLRQTGLNAASVFPLYRAEQRRSLAVLF